VLLTGPHSQDVHDDAVPRAAAQEGVEAVGRWRGPGGLGVGMELGQVPHDAAVLRQHLHRKQNQY